MSSNSNHTTTIRNTDLLAVRAYVTAPETSIRPHADTVLIDMTHSNLKQRHVEIRLDKHQPLTDLYLLFHQKTGSGVSDQVLSLYNQMEDLVIPTLPPYDSPDAARPVAYFLRNTSTTSGSYRVHCTDTNPHSISARGRLENVALVPKFRLTDEEYDQRDNTLRAWAKAQKVADAQFTLKRHAEITHKAYCAAVRAHKLGLPLPPGFAAVDNDGNGPVTIVVASDMGQPQHPVDDDMATVQHCQVGDRCQIQPGRRRGRIAWVGCTTTTLSTNQNSDEKQPSYWVGIVLDEPVGKNDGTWPKTGVRYFEAARGYGIFCRGKNVETGDFPVRDLEDSSSDGEDDDDEEDEL
jgi:tubulin-specific chaperone B